MLLIMWLCVHCDAPALLAIAIKLAFATLFALQAAAWVRSAVEGHRYTILTVLFKDWE